MAQTIIRTFNLINVHEKKYNNRNLDAFSKNLSLEDSYNSIQSCSDKSFSSDDLEIKRNHHYIKHSKVNRNNNNNELITSLKRRVRKRQLQHELDQMTYYPLPTVTTTEVFLASYPQKQPLTSSQHRIKKASCVVPLPSLITNPQPVRTRVHGIKLNIFKD